MFYVCSFGISLPLILRFHISKNSLLISRFLRRVLPFFEKGLWNSRLNPDLLYTYY
jgi:hypothetical protein